MPLLKETAAAGFDTDALQRGNLIRAKYKDWDAAHNGVIACVTREEIRILYLTSTGCVPNFYTIYLRDVLDGLWDVHWGSDFENVQHYAPEAGETNAGL